MHARVSSCSSTACRLLPVGSQNLIPEPSSLNPQPPQEAKQRVPHFLLAIDDPLEEMEALAAASGVKGCVICGGLGHRATQCPKLEAENKATVGKNRDFFGSGGFGGEM